MGKESKFYAQVRKLYLESVDNGKPWGGWKIWRAITAQGETVTSRNIYYLLARVKRECQTEQQ